MTIANLGVCTPDDYETGSYLPNYPDKKQPEWTTELVSACAEKSTDKTTIEEGSSSDSHDTQDVVVEESPAGLSFLGATSNTVNMLIGMGMLSIPYAFSLTGWVLGAALLVVFAWMGYFTANLLVETIDMCYDLQRLRKEPRRKLISLADIAEVSFGRTGKISVSIVFALELFSSSVGLLLLFSDTFLAVFPGLLPPQLVRLCVVVLMLPTIYSRSLSLLATLSSIGIIVLVFTVLILFFDGIWETSAPGSLIVPADTQFWPSSIQNVTLAIGLLFVGFDAHSVIPTLYAGMKKPQSFSKVLSVSYLFSCGMYAFVAICGYRMFGNSVLPEVTRNLPLIDGYVHVLNKVVLVGIMISPLTKLGLVLNPVNALIEQILGITPTVMDVKPIKYATFYRYVSRTLVVAASLGISIAIPDFGTVMGLLGSLLAITIVVVIPCSCYLKTLQLSRNIPVEVTNASNGCEASLENQTVPLKRPSMIKVGSVVLIVAIGIVFLVLGTVGSLAFQPSRQVSSEA